MARYNRKKRGRREQDSLEERLEALRKSNQRIKRKRRRSPVARILLALILLAALLWGIYSLFQLAFAANGGGGQEVTVVINKGDNLSDVADKLQSAKVINNATLFKLEVRLQGEGTDIKPGSYKLRQGENTQKIVQTITAGTTPPTNKITIPEGLTLQQTAQKISEQTTLPEKDLEAAAKKTDYGYAFLKEAKDGTTEGFLFPKSYELDKNATAPQVINRLLEQYLIETQGLNFSDAQKRLGLNEYQIVTVASLVERESANPAERPLIASVIYNRIKAGMPLQIDATIQYALGKPKAELSLQDLEVNSPYNTYKHTGLPPGPIASPSLDSIKAALDPAQTDYLYYVLKADGKEHFFTNNYDDFLKAKAEAGR